MVFHEAADDNNCIRGMRSQSHSGSRWRPTKRHHFIFILFFIVAFYLLRSLYFLLFFLSQVRTGLSFVVDWIKLITMCLFLYPQTNPKYHPNHLLATGPSSNFLPMSKITRQLWMWPVAEVPKLLREHRWILLPVFSRKPNAPLSNRRWIGATVTSWEPSNSSSTTTTILNRRVVMQSMRKELRRTTTTTPTTTNVNRLITRLPGERNRHLVTITIITIIRKRKRLYSGKIVYRLLETLSRTPVEWRDRRPDLHFSHYNPVTSQPLSVTELLVF